MTVDTHRQLVTRFYDEMWNPFDKSVLPHIAHPDVAFRGSLGQVAQGFAELGAYVDLIQAAFPDFHNRVVESIAEGDKLFARLTYTGTHRGELFGIPATGRRIEYAGAAVFTFRDSKIAEVWVLGDLHGLLRQLQD